MATLNDLGVDLGCTECDICGTNWESVEISRDENGVYTLQLSTGCFGGKRFEAPDLDGFLELMVGETEFMRSKFSAHLVEWHQLIEDAKTMPLGAGQ